MNKYSISAAILAVTMMGCTDTGLDNSVASTSEAKSEQAQPFDEKAIALFKTSYTCGDFRSFASGCTQTIGSHSYTMLFVSGVDALNQGFGEVNIMRDNAPSVVADFAHIISACVQGCDDFGNCQLFDVQQESKSKVRFANYIAAGLRLPGMKTSCNKISEQKMSGDIGVVSIYSVFFDAGKSEEVNLSAATYTQNLSYEKAVRIYQKYIMPEQLKLVGR